MRNHTLIYWKEDNFYVGKLLEHPEIMTQGETLEELEINIKDAHIIMYPGRGGSSQMRKRGGE